MNYTLVVNSSLKREILALTSDPDDDEYLSLRVSLSNENTLYTFSILVTNEVGTVPTSDKQFCKFYPSFIVLMTSFGDPFSL